MKPSCIRNIIWSLFWLSYRCLLIFYIWTKTLFKNYNNPGLCHTGLTKADWILRGPRSSSFWVPRNLSHHMIRQARTGVTMLVKSREMTGRTQTLPWWLGWEGVKAMENKYRWPRWVWQVKYHTVYHISLLLESLDLNFCLSWEFCTQFQGT
jgi:hypothetical protein